MITSLRNCPLSRHCRSSIVTVIPPFSGGGGNWINLSRGERKKNESTYSSDIKDVATAVHSQSDHRFEYIHAVVGSL